MKINKEDFNKLPQLDRIEFRQKRREIDEKYPISISNTVNSIYLIAFYLIVIIICRTYYASIGSSIIVNPTPWIIIILPLAYIGDITDMIMNSKRTKELAQEYFKVEVKKK